MISAEKKDDEMLTSPTLDIKVCPVCHRLVRETSYHYHISRLWNFYANGFAIGIIGSTTGINTLTSEIVFDYSDEYEELVTCLEQSDVSQEFKDAVMVQCRNKKGHTEKIVPLKMGLDKIINHDFFTRCQNDQDFVRLVETFLNDVSLLEKKDD